MPDFGWLAECVLTRHRESGRILIVSNKCSNCGLEFVTEEWWTLGEGNVTFRVNGGIYIYTTTEQAMVGIYTRADIQLATRFQII